MWVRRRLATNSLCRQYCSRSLKPTSFASVFKKCVSSRQNVSSLTVVNGSIGESGLRLASKTRMPDSWNSWTTSIWSVSLPSSSSRARCACIWPIFPIARWRPAWEAWAATRVQHASGCSSEVLPCVSSTRTSPLARSITSRDVGTSGPSSIRYGSWRRESTIRSMTMTTSSGWATRTRVYIGRATWAECRWTKRCRRFGRAMSANCWRSTS
mmetsp:Transcript_92320/g.260824  ORF Transcript_92320/g.260824 Transcript_92320/m.260824 type:complete len:212 (-) Transcript_92320:1509-2144(-)